MQIIHDFDLEFLFGVFHLISRLKVVISDTNFPSHKNICTFTELLPLTMTSEQLMDKYVEERGRRWICDQLRVLQQGYISRHVWLHSLISRTSLMNLEQV